MSYRLLDLFCCRGCASVGYDRAGFEVTGVDIDPECTHFYPFTMHVTDALAFARARGREFDAIHASPPCQASTTMSNRYRGAGGKADEWENLIPETLAVLTELGLPFVVENVVGARADMPNAATLHGGMFGLGVDRPRLFATNWPLMVMGAPRVRNPLGVYGARPDGRRLWTRADGTEQRAPRSIEQAAKSMGVDFPIDWTGLREAIPPAYTEFIGRQLIEHLEQEAAA